MKVLWITNTLFPDLSKALGHDSPVLGGWMYSLANDLIKNGVNLVVATVGHGVNEHHEIIKGVEYFLLKGQKSILEYDPSLENKWKNIIKSTNPDIVHIHGTEYAHGLSLIKACPNLKYLLSIQGVVYECARYYEGGISKKSILKNKTFRDYVKNDGILETKRKFYDRAKRVEKEYIESVNHILHRSEWDRGYAKTHNMKCAYYLCHDSLRDSFYNSDKWKIQNIRKHSLFMSQAGYPLKGLHKLLEALPLIVNEFPNLKLKIAGHNIIKVDTFKDRLRLNGYGKYLLSLIKKYKIINHIEFTGSLSEKEMVQEYLNSHILISASSIDNVPNSVLEAQYLGVPVIASNVGGVPEMIEHGKTGILYPFDDVEMLAKNIKEIFLNDSKAEQLSKKEISLATKRQNRAINLEKIIEVYQTILSV